MTPEQLRELLVAARCVFFDFDGPLLDLFGGYPAAEVAGTLRERVASWQRTLVLTKPENPVQILLDVAHGFGGPEPDHRVVELGKLLADQEILAVASAPATPHAEQLVRQLVSTGRTVAVTTNNSADAAASYLRLYGLTDCFGGRVHGRPADPRLMKPDPACVLAALESTQADPSACLLIGDSPHDYEAARAVHVPFLGYAKDVGEEEELRGAGASHIVRSLALVYEAVVPA